MASSRVGYGQRRIRITPEVFEAWLVNENRVRTDLPDDARFLGLWPPTSDDEYANGTYMALFESEAWDGLAEGETIPLITPAVERLDG